MRITTIGLVAQRTALCYAEAVLLVNHSQAQPGKLNAGLYQCVGADDNVDSAVRQPIIRSIAVALVDIASQQCNVDFRAKVIAEQR